MHNTAVDVAAERFEAPPPPACALHVGTQAKLLALASASPAGVCVRGDWVAVHGFDVPWSTAFFSVLGVPAAMVGRVAAVAAYAAALHARMLDAYRRRGLALPRWRSWAELCARWPFLSPPAPAAAPPPPPTLAPVPRTRVHVLRPL